MINAVSSGWYQDYSLTGEVNSVKTESSEIKDTYNTLSSEARKITRSVENVESLVTDETSAADSAKVSSIVNKCTSLLTRASEKSLSKGERTYLETEINYLKQNINFLNIAL